MASYPRRPRRCAPRGRPGCPGSAARPGGGAAPRSACRVPECRGRARGAQKCLRPSLPERSVARQVRPFLEPEHGGRRLVVDAPGHARLGQEAEVDETLLQVARRRRRRHPIHGRRDRSTEVVSREEADRNAAFDEHPHGEDAGNAPDGANELSDASLERGLVPPAANRAPRSTVTTRRAIVTRPERRPRGTAERIPRLRSAGVGPARSCWTAASIVVPLRTTGTGSPSAENQTLTPAPATPGSASAHDTTARKALHFTEVGFDTLLLISYRDRQRQRSLKPDSPRADEPETRRDSSSEHPCRRPPRHVPARTARPTRSRSSSRIADWRMSSTTSSRSSRSTRSSSASPIPSATSSLTTTSRSTKPTRRRAS